MLLRVVATQITLICTSPVYTRLTTQPRHIRRVFPRVHEGRGYFPWRALPSLVLGSPSSWPPRGHVANTAKALAEPAVPDAVGGMSGKSVDLGARLTYLGRDWPTWR